MSEISIKEQQALLVQEKERIETEQKNITEKIKELMLAEKPQQGIFFAQEIHNLKQKQNRLTVELLFCLNKIKKLSYVSF
ncbi:hypothetical protein [Desulfovibrio litoralis]|uniref:Uncharacterized protein n=1 Tax=Desulfovibrio litoralis DSM 11393 TaxID=1121455 RepID=A0A1M7SBU7_9BACT|nr:hypothetical protein [Desulfovibrio litoralis]SHN56007.1 hypothetical protein SAMN02745728_00741 [Desulfovibrio litoralis DSM 11393]